MNQLSLAARTMLGRRPRRQTLTEREAIIEQITRAGLPVFEPIVAFQEHYGGIEYAVRGEAIGFSFDLFEGFDPKEPWEFNALQDAQGYWGFHCGDEAWAPFWFSIRQDGAVCVDGTDDVLMAIATSVEKYIESDAIRDGLLDLQPTWWELFFHTADYRALDSVFAQGRQIVNVASDACTTWWADERSRIVRHMLLDSYTIKGVTAYFTSRGAAVQFAEAVRAVLDGSSLDVLPSPFEIKEHRASAAYGG
jgi:hypothetical protein